MKILTGLCLFLASVAANAESHGLLYYKSVDCGTFLANENHPAVRQSVGDFARGYVTAYNFFEGSLKERQVTGDLANDRVAAYMGRFCRDNPLAGVHEGVLPMIKGLLARGGK